jgi:hypothetical protein
MAVLVNVLFVLDLERSKVEFQILAYFNPPERYVNFIIISILPKNSPPKVLIVYHSITGIGSLPPNTTSAKLHSLFSPFGNIESARVLTHKNCGFINFDTVESAVAAKMALQHKEVLGSGTGAVRIGFAKATTQKTMEESSPVQSLGLNPSIASTSKQERTVDATNIRENSESGSISNTKPSTEPVETSNLSKIMAIMTEFGMDSDDGPVFKIGKREYFF